MHKGYKAMNSNMTCRGFKFEVGGTYKIQGDVSLCQNGFHFCENLLDVYNYYPKNTSAVVCEVEAIGDVVKNDDKSVTSEIKIIRRVSEKEILEAIFCDRNSGDRNSGYGNSGNWNSGNWNSGNRNSGDSNSGDSNSGYGNSGNRNSGDRNSGYGNSGYGNSGDSNSGDSNSGYGNSGNWNSGSYNKGNRNSGFFNTKTPIYFFNKPTDFVPTEKFESRLLSINVKTVLTWVSSKQMSEEEKNKNPNHKITGGFLRKADRLDWSQLTEDDKAFIRSLPNFDNDVFMEISGGVSLLDDIEVIVNGVTKRISKAKAKELGLIE